jgi:16S rRNA (guanine527-N7)-methyltransferase
MIDFNQFVPDLPEGAADQLRKLRPLYEEWNAAINVISRKDMDAFEERHVLHSLAIFKAMRFSPGSRVLDVGTGGGFPGIPLAIVCPDVNFVLCDSIGKKMKVVRAIVKELGLKNVIVHHGRAEEISGRFDFVVSRAVTRMDRFLPWVMNKMEARSLNPWPNGVLALKGGDLKEEMNEVKQTTEVIPIAQWFDAPFFETKSVVYVRLK